MLTKGPTLVIPARKSLRKRWPGTWLFAEPKSLKARHMASHQKPAHMSWEDWCDYHRKGYWSGYECHWYDPWYGREHNTNSNGGCSGGTGHRHRSRIMGWYWANPITQILLGPILMFYEAAEAIEDTWTARGEDWRWHKYVLRHRVVKYKGIQPTYRTAGGINVFEQDTFQAPGPYRECVTCHKRL